jgi:DNA polymerase-1
VKKKLEENKENAFLSKELVTINCSVPMKFDFEKAEFEKPEFDKLRELFIELEFKNLYTRLLKIYNHGADQKPISEEELFTAKTFDKSKSKYELITTKKEAEKLAEKLNKTSLLVFDTETDSLNPFELNILGASFSTKAGEGYFVAIDPGSRIFSDGEKRLPVDDFKKIFKPLLENKKIKKVCQNGKFDISVMRSIGIKVENFYFDTMVASYIIDPDQRHGMDNLSEKYLSYQPIPLSDLIGEKKDPTKMYDVEIEKLF